MFFRPILLDLFLPEGAFSYGELKCQSRPNSSKIKRIYLKTTPSNVYFSLQATAIISIYNLILAYQETRRDFGALQWKESNVWHSITTSTAQPWVALLFMFKGPTERGGSYGSSLVTGETAGSKRRSRRVTRQLSTGLVFVVKFCEWQRNFELIIYLFNRNTSGSLGEREMKFFRVLQNFHERMY